VWGIVDKTEARLAPGSTPTFFTVATIFYIFPNLLMFIPMISQTKQLFSNGLKFAPGKGNRISNIE
jgi:hypothetical protein